MSAKRSRILVVLLAMLIMVTPAYAHLAPTTNGRAFQSDATQVVVPAGEPIKLGLATDLSNVLPEPGADIRNGALLAAKERNEMGGIQGFTIEIDVQDDRCDGADATNVANLFASDPQIVAVVGHVCSGASKNAAEVYQDARIPMVSASSTRADLTQSGFDVFNRVAFTDGAQGTVDARFLYDQVGAMTLAIAHDNSDYGKGLAETVGAEFAQIGGTVVGDPVVISTEDQDYRPALQVLAAEPPDALFFGGYQQQAALMVAQMKEVGLEDTIFMSGDGTYTQAYLDAAGEAAEASYASFVDSSSFANVERNAAFDAAYEAEFGVNPNDLGPFHYHAYDAAMILMNAIDSVATLDDAGNLVINREELIAAVRATKDYDGLTGMLSCDENGECGAGVIGVNLVEDGAWVTVEVPEGLQYGNPYPPTEEGGTGEMPATVVDAVASVTDASTLAAVLTQFAPAIGEALSGECTFTVFVPVDAAFGALPPDVTNAALADPALLESILTYHVVPGALMAADVAGMTELTTLNGAVITVTVDGDTVLLNGTIKIIQTDIVAGNGVVHLIDGVLLPPTE